MSPELSIKNIFSFEQPFEHNGAQTFSVIINLLRGARYLCGADLDTGEYKLINLGFSVENNLYHSFSFSGILNYLILLEQIGTLVEPKIKSENTDEKAIKRALFYFSNLDKEERIILAQLRNCLAHRFSLSTEKDSKYPHKFILSIEESAEVIKKPMFKWDGDFSNKDENYSTTIYSKNLIQLIEDIFLNIQTLAQEEKLSLIVEDGVEELFTRYAIK
ncbi:hypothetical protein [Chryseobacterium sp. 5_R23647]|uniref:hypothetical protein n=1 Tax=Chryseobacterium sp. 5_R23647 TaxID=2258964 RepID=UPI000E25A60E|nr:hypothetical protein [Chryseobacterium sp. 5_R23647]REC40268.1 hypothetical protein DRF69_19320 [Chryseobacterium sp. 5_R23647]